MNTYEQWGDELLEPGARVSPSMLREMYDAWTADREELLRRGMEKDNEIEETVERVEAQLRRAEAAEAKLARLDDIRIAQMDLERSSDGPVADTSDGYQLTGIEQDLERLEAVTEERDKLAERVRVLEEALKREELDRESAEAREVDILSDEERHVRALRSIAANTCCATCQEAALVARAALEEKGSTK